ncbi:hypothetical protein BDN72DRAFT_904580 [Pluteus cervinus]|uniref:Uncharacterized protein n=1 Tax=Pluteus cervinus TaxID=181527 RepID=A0ACD3A5E6_9AGAR|nr:hypothetical protein BDN72DRAFT_904580 [Pluteus cervinus]
MKRSSQRSKELDDAPRQTLSEQIQQAEQGLIQGTRSARSKAQGVWRNALEHREATQASAEGSSQSKKRKHQSNDDDATNEDDEAPEESESKKMKQRPYRPASIDEDEEGGDEEEHEMDVTSASASIKFGPPRGRPGAQTGQTPGPQTGSSHTSSQTTAQALKAKNGPAHPTSSSNRRRGSVSSDGGYSREDDDLDSQLDLKREAITFSSKTRRAAKEPKEEEEEDEEEDPEQDPLLSPKTHKPKTTTSTARATRGTGSRIPVEDDDDAMDVDPDDFDALTGLKPRTARRSRNTAAEPPSSPEASPSRLQRANPSKGHRRSVSMPTPSSLHPKTTTKSLTKGSTRLEKHRNEVPSWPEPASTDSHTAKKHKGPPSQDQLTTVDEDEDASAAVEIPGYVPGSTEHLWAIDARIVFPTEGGSGIKLTSQRRGVRDLFNEALRLVMISITVDTPWPERTTAAVLTKQYFKRATQSLELPQASTLYRRVHKDDIFSQVLSPMARLKLRHKVDPLVEDGYQLKKFSQEPCIEFVRKLRQDKAFIYHIDFKKVYLTSVLFFRQHPQLNVFQEQRRQVETLSFAGGEKSLYRRHPSLFASEIPGCKHEEFPSGMICFAATVIYASLGDWTTGEFLSNNTQFSLKNFSKKYDEFNGLLDQEYEKGKDEYVILMKTMFERARAKYSDADTSLPESSRPRKKTMQALGL